MTFFDFVQWCFRDQRSSGLTVIVGALVLYAFVDLAKAIRGRGE